MRNNNRGMSIIEAVIAVGVGLGLVMVGLAVMQIVDVQSSKMEQFSELNDLRNRLNLYFNDLRAVRNTIDNNTTMVCLSDSSMQCLPSVRDFDLFDGRAAAPQLVEEFRQVAGAGFTRRGAPCNTYPAEPCVIRYRTQWQPMCSSDMLRCRAPSYKLLATLEISPNASPEVRIKRELYKLEVVRSSAGEMLASVCTSMGGILETVDGATTCALPMNRSCPPGTFFVGVNADASKNCRALVAQSCPLGTVSVAMDSSGNVTCSGACYTTTLTCSFNMWTAESNCPTGIDWQSGVGITGNEAFGPSPFSTNLIFNSGDGGDGDAAGSDAGDGGDASDAGGDAGGDSGE
jgi:hypothetical protein